MERGTSAGHVVGQHLTRGHRALAMVVAVMVAMVWLGGCGGSRPAVEVDRREVGEAGVVITSVGVLDVERGAVKANQDVTLKGGVIASIAPAGSQPTEPGAVVIDGQGATLLPGLIDVHGHIYADSSPTWVNRLPDPEANLREYLYAGVTTVFDPGDSSGDAIGRRERVASGELIGPHIRTAGPLLTIDGGHPIALVEAFAPWWISWYLAPRVATAVGSPEAARAAVDGLADRDVDFVKIAVDRIPLDAPRMDREIASAIVQQAAEHDLRVVAHIGTTEDAVDTAEAGVAAWVHGVYKERIPEGEIARLAMYQIPMVVTIEVFDRYARALDGPFGANRLERQMVPADMLASFHPPPDDFELGALEGWLALTAENRGAMIDNAARLYEAGVILLAGSDTQSGVFPGAGLHRELVHLTRAGMRPAMAIRAATLDAARFLEDDGDPSYGTVRVGKRADLVLVDGDPSRDIDALLDIREVFLEGVPLVRTPLSGGDG